MAKGRKVNVSISLFDDEDFACTEPIWITSDGRPYRIPEMSTEHIRNCIRVIYQRNGTWRHEFLKLFQAELRKRRRAGSDFDDDTTVLQKKELGRILKQIGETLLYD